MDQDHQQDQQQQQSDKVAMDTSGSSSSDDDDDDEEMALTDGATLLDCASSPSLSPVSSSLSFSPSASPMPLVSLMGATGVKTFDGDSDSGSGSGSSGGDQNLAAMIHQRDLLEIIHSFLHKKAKVPTLDMKDSQGRTVVQAARTPITATEILRRHGYGGPWPQQQQQQQQQQQPGKQQQQQHSEQRRQQQTKSPPQNIRQRSAASSLDRIWKCPY